MFDVICRPDTHNVRVRFIGAVSPASPILTVHPERVYAHPVAFNSAIGFGDPEFLRGEQPLSGYFCSQRSCASISSMAGRAGRPSGLPGPRNRFANPASVCHPRLATVMAGLHMQSEEP